jgi:two-component system, OmpR family, phosphate regulon sensor histidine kinase PhoR
VKGAKAMNAPNDEAWIHFIQRPALYIDDQRVVGANDPAKKLLGSHIEGQDIRLAIRRPEVISLVNHPEGGSLMTGGIITSDQEWLVSCDVMKSGIKLLILEDISYQANLARAHADFVANASHELRTPLAAILGYVETLLDPKAGADDNTRNRFLTIIKSEAERMQALVEDLMSLSRIEANKHELPDSPVDLVTLVKIVADETTAPITFTHDAAKVKMNGDLPQLKQMLHNLIDNAVKYGDNGTPVTVSIETGRKGWAIMTVHNEGPSIPPVDIPRLTERFYRVDAGRSRKVGGTGLGLSIVKHIVERHRGRIDISSRPGEGTSVALYMPLS